MTFITLLFIFISALAISLAGVESLPARAAEAQNITGSVRVVDGDTLKMEGQSIRLYGIDAPEQGQACNDNGVTKSCGEDATCALRQFISERPVTCQEKDRDRYRRIVAVCYAGNTDLGAWAVRHGWALAYRQYGGDRYNTEEIKAQNESLGIWPLSFVLPQEWRKQNPGKKGRRNYDCTNFSSRSAAPDFSQRKTDPAHEPRRPDRDYDCKDFTSQKDAQAFFEREGGPARDPHRLDGNKDGVACQSLR